MKVHYCLRIQHLLAVEAGLCRVSGQSYCGAEMLTIVAGCFLIADQFQLQNAGMQIATATDKDIQIQELKAKVQRQKVLHRLVLIYAPRELLHSTAIRYTFLVFLELE